MIEKSIVFMGIKTLNTLRPLLTDSVQMVVEKLRQEGRIVEEQDVPGLWRVDGGPEITGNQLINLFISEPDQNA